MGHTNIEIKAKSSNHDKIRGILKSKNADFKGIDNQTDTYFSVPNGRLKLREGNIENCLIHYDRENKSDAKQSNVTLYEFNPKSSFKDILLKSLVILMIVDKQREIYWINNVKNSTDFLSTPKISDFSGVKFHLDNVKNLGKFVEIEAIDYQGNIKRDKLTEQCNYYMDLFKIPKDDLIACSYSDLFLQNLVLKK